MAFLVSSIAHSQNKTSDTFGTGGNQFGIDFVTVGNPGNRNDTTGYGGVPYSYRIGKYTISQNQIDAATRSGLQNVTAGAWSGDKPAAYITWYEAAAYVNWLNTSQGYRPAYNLTYTNGSWIMALWPTSPDSNGNVAWTYGGTNLYRSANCVYFLPSENEWYKAAYYDPTKNAGSGGYWQYPTRTDTLPTAVSSGANQGTAVYDQPWNNGPASVFLAGGLSPFGTMGQGGNVWQWVESAYDKNNDDPHEARGWRGDDWYYYPDGLQSTIYRWGYPDNEGPNYGFRVARKDPNQPGNNQHITFPVIPILTITNTSYTLGASVDSGLPVTYSIGNSSIAAITNGLLVPLRIGTTTIVATQAGDSNYLAATPVTNQLVVSKASNAISFAALASRTYGSETFSIGATASSGLPVTYSTPNTNWITISGSNVTILGAGTAIIVASQAGNSNYLAAASVTNSLVIAKASNTIASFGSIPSQTYSNGATVTITPPIANSSLPVTVMVKSGPATLSGNTVTLTGVGTVVLAANQSGNGNYLAASEVTTSFSVEQSSQTIGVFTVIPEQAYGDAPFSVSAPAASSGLPVVLSVVSGPATIRGNTVSITGVGSVVLGADQAGNGNYLAAAQVTTRFSVVPSIQPLPQQITEDLVYGVDPITLASTNLLGFPLSYSVSGPATISGITLTITGGGTVTLVTSQAGNANYLPASITNSFVVSRAEQTLIPEATNAVTYGVSPIGLAPTNALGLPLTYSVTGPASISSNLLSITGGGTVTLVTSQDGNANYLPKSVTNSFVVNPAPQNFTPSPVASLTYGSLPFGLTLPTNASGLPITARIVSGPATLSGTNIILSGTGTVTLAYEAPGNDLYDAASVTNSFMVTNGLTNLRSQTITFKALAAKAYGSAPQALAGSASSKLPVTYWSSNTNVAVINGTNAVITGAGSTVITAYQPGDGSTYNPASPVSQTLLVNQSSQKLTLKAPKSVAYGSTPAAITATSSAGLPVTLTSSDTSIATITNSGTNSLLVPTGVGTITLTATQAGNTNVGAAIPVGQSIVISPGKQTITFAALGTNTFGASPMTLTATSSAGLPVSFTSSATKVATISGDTLTIMGAGSAKITASQAGSRLWAPAKAVTQSLTVAKASQTISFSIPTTVTYSKGGLVTLGATATSGLPVAYKSGNTKVLSITGSTCVITGRGTTTVVASQPGGANYLPATAITNTITVQ